MKKLFVLACALALFVQAACAPIIDNKTTPAPTAEITAAPTDVPTEAPTAAPTEKPSEAPGTPAKPELVFPTLVTPDMMEEAIQKMLEGK